jgi:DNA-binding CsgD family transcriptional regulator
MMAQYPSPPSRQPVIVGRDREQELLRHLLGAALAGAGHVVLIGGEAGIGKTTLTTWLAAEAAIWDVQVLIGGCYDLTSTPPYGSWIDLFDRFPLRDDPPTLTDLLKGIATIDAVTNQEALFAHVRAAVGSLAAQRPLLLILEDLHWSDQASLDLLRYLARDAASLRLLLVVTYRLDEITRRHPLFHLLPLLVREARAERIDLRPLENADINAMIATRYQLMAHDQARLVTYLKDHSEGNPFFMSEILRTLEAEGFLIAEEDTWLLKNLERVPVPALVQQVIEGRLSRLEADIREHLAIAAVIGQEIAFETWSKVAGVPIDVVLDAADRAIEEQFLAVASGGMSVRFIHALIREALYESTRPGQRRRWHQTAGDTAANAARPDPDLVAYHFRRAGDARAIDWLVQAGDRAQRSYAWSVAVERFEMAISLLEQEPERAGEQGWLLYRVGKLLRFSDTARGIAYLHDAAEVASAINDRTLAAYALFDQGMLRCVALDIQRGLAEMAAGVDALKALPDEDIDLAQNIAVWVADAIPQTIPRGSKPAEASRPPQWAMMRTGTYVLWLAWAGHLHEARRIGEEYIVQAGTVPAAIDCYGDACNGLGSVYAALGYPSEARAMFARARTAYQSIGHHILEGVASWSDLRDVLLVYYPERIEERRQVTDNAVQAWLKGTSGGVTGPARQRLPLLLLEGRWSEIREIVLSMPEHVRIRYRHGDSGTLGTVAYYQGDTELAWTLVHQGLPQGTDTEPGSVFYKDHAPVLQRLAAMLSLDSGDFTAARAWLTTHDRWLAWSGSLPGRVEAKLLWTQYDEAQGNLSNALEHAMAALELAGNPRQPLAQLAAHRFLGRIYTQSQRLADASQHLQQALTLADTCAAPFERALTLLELARLRLAENAGAEARDLLREVRAICEALDAQPTLTQVAALERELQRQEEIRDFPAGLTPREVEVLRLVAQGLTDAEVAEQLFVARRTVNTHLTSIYTKLGVSSRAAATRFAVEQGLTET